MTYGGSCVVRDTKSILMGNEVLGEHLIFLRFFRAGGVLKCPLLIEGIGSMEQKSMVSRLKRHVSGIKNPSTMICSAMQI